MEPKRKSSVAYIVVALLFLAAVVAYAAFPEKAPERPIRIMFQSSAGNVLFSMKDHNEEEVYGYACVECHHEVDPEIEIPTPTPCGECHKLTKEESEEKGDGMDRETAFHDQCIKCHEDDAMAPVLCETCHFMSNPLAVEF